jgi:hypothetical protein
VKVFLFLPIFVIGIGLVERGPRLQDKNPRRVDSAKVSYIASIAPLLVKNCQPCHYPGGKVFKKLPFENYLVVKKLGLKLNTRFKTEEQQSLVKRWVEAGAPKE